MTSRFIWLGTVNGVVFTKVDGLIRAESQHGGELMKFQVVRAAKKVGIESEKWQKSEYTETFLLEV